MATPRAMRFTVTGWRYTAVSLVIALHLLSCAVRESTAQTADRVFVRATTTVAAQETTGNVVFADASLSKWDPCGITQPICITVCAPTGNTVTAMTLTVKGHPRTLSLTGGPDLGGTNSACKAVCSCAIFTGLQAADCGEVGATEVTVGVTVGTALTEEGSLTGILASDGSEQDTAGYLVTAFGGRDVCTVAGGSVSQQKVAVQSGEVPVCGTEGDHAVWTTASITTALADAMATAEAFTVTTGAPAVTCPGGDELSSLSVFTSGVSTDNDSGSAVFTVNVAAAFTAAAIKSDAPYVLTACLNGYREAATLQFAVSATAAAVNMKETERQDTEDRCFTLTSCDIWDAMTKANANSIEALVFTANKHTSELNGAVVRGVFGTAVLASGEGEPEVKGATNVGISVKKDFKACHLKEGQKEEKGIKMDGSKPIPVCQKTDASDTTVLATFVSGEHPKAEDFTAGSMPAARKFSCSGALRGLGINGVVSALALAVLALQRRI